MSRRLTAADRSALIRLASALPAGDETRRAILAGLSRVAMTRSVTLDKSRHSELSDILEFHDVEIDPSLPAEAAPILDGVEAAIRKVHRRFKRVHEESDDFQNRLQAGDELMATVGDFFRALNKSSKFDADTIVRLWDKAVADNAGDGLVDGEEFDQFLGPYGAAELRKAVTKKTR